MAGFFDALASAELFLLGVLVDRVEPAQAWVADLVALPSAGNTQTEVEFRDEHYRTALG